MEVKLHAFWASSDCNMVQHALKFKNVEFEYVEVTIDIDNNFSSEIHKKFPILEVDGKPISNPSVIFEFIEDTWTLPPLFPKDPFLKSRVRFWMDFFYKKIMPTSFAIIFTKGDEHEKATKEFIELMVTMEDGVSEDFANGGPFIHGSESGMLDVMMGSCSNGLKALGAIPGVDLVDKERMPRLSKAIVAFLSLEKSSEIPYKELLELHWVLREQGSALV